MKKKDPAHHTQQLGNLLLKYKSLIKPPQSSVVKESIEVIKEVTGLTLVESQLTYTVTTRTLVIKAPSVLGAEIKRHHELILKTLTTRLGEGNAPKSIL